MPPSPSDSLIAVLARQFTLGALGGCMLLAICIIENVAGLAYMVLAGGPITLGILIAVFGSAGGFLTMAFSLYLHWHERSVAKMQLIPAPAAHEGHPANQRLQ